MTNLYEDNKLAFFGTLTHCGVTVGYGRVLGLYVEQRHSLVGPLLTQKSSPSAFA